MADTQLNSPFSIQIPRDPPAGLPKEVQAVMESIFSALYQLQIALVNFCGIGPQPQAQWSQLTAIQTILQQNMNRVYMLASETVLGGALVNFVNSGGVIKAQNANATDNTKPAQGFCNVSGGTAGGSYGEFIMFSGLCQLISGLTIGSVYYLSTTSGLLTTVKPVAAGNIEQMVGVAVDINVLYFTSHHWVQH